jgi:hypothetical protein
MSSVARHTFLRLSLPFFIAVSSKLMAGDAHNRDSLGELKTGDHIRLALDKKTPVSGEFLSWTPESITVGNSSERGEDVVKVERFT